ncbi:nucleotide-binding universal stress UspA family protein [Catenulispora sp. MAP12-49]
MPYPGRVLIAAAVVPHPPVLLPEVAQGFAPDLDTLRSACQTAVGRLYAAGADEVLIVGAGPEQGGAVLAQGSFRAYGVDLDVDGRWGPVAGNAVPMTLPFLVAAWLLRDRPAEPVRRAVMVDERGGAAVPAVPAIGGARQAMLVLGDGSASRTPQAPGHFDERAEPYDALVARALATADTKALAGLDPELSRELHVAGLPAWRVLADAAAASGVEYDADLLYDQAPYGVGYFVATWLAR